MESTEQSFKLSPFNKSKRPFCFLTSSVLVILTGKKAHHLKGFVEKLRTMDGNVIFYHIHNSYREYHFAPGKYTNDFAYWIGEALGESTLAEKIANIEIGEFTSLIALRDKIVAVVEQYLESAVEIRRSAPGKEFYFCRNISFVMPTKYEVNSLDEFCEAIKKVGMRSLYYHFFEARLRLGHKSNDFSEWINSDLTGYDDLAEKIERLNPYLYTLDELRDKIIDLIEEKTKLPIVRKMKKWLHLS